MTAAESSPERNASLSDEEHSRRMTELAAAQREKVKAAAESRGVVVLHTGDGKGKSTGAFGTIMRAVGHGQRVALVQFIKGTWKTGERNVIERFPEVDHFISGDGFTWITKDRQNDINSAERGWAHAEACINAMEGDKPTYDLVVLDEINIALRYDYLDVEKVAEVVRNKPREQSIILTGRDAKPELIAVADTVTEHTLVKHAFEAGIKARQGVEF